RLRRAVCHRRRDGAGAAAAALGGADRSGTGADREVIGGRRRTAAGELERADARLPVEGSVGGDVLVDVPERAVVAGVDRDGAVVTPTAQALRGLGPGAVDDRPLPLRHGPRRIARQPARVVNLGVERAAAEAETEAHVAGMVHGDAAHPAIVGVRRVGSLLIDGEAAAGNAQLVPTDPDRATGADAVVDDEGLVVAEVAVGEAVHEPVGEGVELLAGARLGNADAAAAGLRVRGSAESGRAGEGRTARRRPVGVEL